MAETIRVQLVTPERSVLSDDVDMVVVPGTEGDFGVLPKHAPLVSAIRAGIVILHGGSKAHEGILVIGGFAEVNSDGCTILADEAHPLSEISVELAEKRLKDAELHMRHSEDPKEVEQAKKEHEIAEIYLHFAKKAA